MVVVIPEFGDHKFSVALIGNIIWFSLVVHEDKGAGSEAEEADS